MSSKYTKACFFGELNGKTVNSSFGEKYLPVYDRQYKDLLEWKARLAKTSSDDMQATADEFVKAIKANKLLDLLKQDDEK